jgi:hypothetical protein
MTTPAFGTAICLTGCLIVAAIVVLAVFMGRTRR